MEEPTHNPGELLKLLLEGDAPDYVWEKGDWELDPTSLTVRKSTKDPSEGKASKPEVREVHPAELVKAQDVDVVLERTDSLPDDKRAQLKDICHVRGCGKSVLALRDFNQRYHICGEHIKAPRILRNGRVERFCQQCSRFHAVTEFEGVKRSCRKQLERHNARRRKRQDAGAATAAASGAVAESKPAIAAAAAAWGATSGTASGGPAGSAGGSAHGNVAGAFAPVAGSSSVLPANLMVTFMQNLFSHPQIFRSIRRMLAPRNVDNTLEMYRSSVLSAAIRQVEGEALPKDALSELRISLKLRGGLPDSLPENLRHAVFVWLQAEQPHMCGCMRSGCVFVTLSVVLRLAERERAATRGALSLLRAILASDSRWADKHLTVQIDDSIAYSQPHKEPVQIHAAEASFAAKLPRLTAVSAPVLVTDRETSIRLIVRGEHLHHISAAGGRRGGGTPVGQAAPAPRIARCGHDDSLMRSTSWFGGDTAEVLICAPELSVDGCAVVWLEAWTGAYLSPAIPLFVTSNTELACRVENLTYSLMDGLKDRVPFNTTGWRCSLNMYLRLCTRPHDSLRSVASVAAGSAPGGPAMWDHGSRAPARGRHAAEPHPQLSLLTGWGDGAFNALHDDGGHGHEGNSVGEARATPFATGYSGLPPEAAQQAWAVQQAWPQGPQRMPQAQQMWLAAEQHMNSAVAAAAGASAAAGGGDDLPVAKRPAAADAWPGYHGGQNGHKGHGSMHAHHAQHTQHVQHAHHAQHAESGPRGLYARHTAFDGSGALPSDVPDHAPPDDGAQSQPEGSMEVPPSTDFSEMLDNMLNGQGP